MKKKCKKIKPILNDGNVFWSGGSIVDNIKVAKAGGVDAAAAGQAALGQGLGVAQGAMQLGSQIATNFDTSGIGDEVVNTSALSRGDVLNSNTNVDSNQTNAAGQGLSGMMTGLNAGKDFGIGGAAIGAGIGLIAGAGSAILGNNKKQLVADRAEQK